VQPTTLKALFAIEFIDLPAAAQFESAQWETFQIGLLNNQTRFGIDTKSRQIAWSFSAALDAIADSRITPGHPYIFVSINLEEAKEKIRYAKAIIEATHPDYRPELVRDSATELEFSDGTRLISHPCRPPRGKPQARVYLDEFAHYPDGLDRQIYTAALPATTKGDGYIRIGSSPLGASGMHWEIQTQTLRPYPGYKGYRRLVPWWNIRAMCKDVPMARQIARAMSTHERVYAFGTQAIIDIYENMFLEDFQQEYECSWVDEAVAWISWELIKRNQPKDGVDLFHYHAKSVDEAISLIPQIKADIRAMNIETVLTAGIDVGRKKHLTEFVALGLSTTEQLPVRLMVSLDRVEFDDQQRCFAELLHLLPINQCLIDRNGLGAQLAENLERMFPGRAQGMDFTNPHKELWAVEARIQAERGNTPLPLQRDLAYQIHSIKKKFTSAKNSVFDTEGNEKHHADKFWAWALAIWAGVGERNSASKHKVYVG
jgi:phage FluMu gp28-like protein